MIKSKLLVFGSKNFNNSIEEIKKNLEYSLLFFDFIPRRGYMFIEQITLDWFDPNAVVFTVIYIFL